MPRVFIAEGAAKAAKEEASDLAFDSDEAAKEVGLGSNGGGFGFGFGDDAALRAHVALSAVSSRAGAGSRGSGGRGKGGSGSEGGVGGGGGSGSSSSSSSRGRGSAGAGSAEKTRLVLGFQASLLPAELRRAPPTAFSSFRTERNVALKAAGVSVASERALRIKEEWKGVDAAARATKLSAARLV